MIYYFFIYMDGSGTTPNSPIFEMTIFLYHIRMKFLTLSFKTLILVTFLFLFLFFLRQDLTIVPVLLELTP